MSDNTSKFINNVFFTSVGVIILLPTVLLIFRVISDMFNSHSDAGLIGIIVLLVATATAGWMGVKALVKSGKQKETPNNEVE